MSLVITKDTQLNIGMSNTSEKNTKQTDGAEEFSDYFRKGRIKHLEGSKPVLSSGQDSKNSYFIMSKDGVTVSYNGVTFLCNHESGALELGDCSRRDKCIRVPLAEGGSLLFNPDSMGGVNKAIGMFSAEDQGRIMRAIQMFNMAKQKLDEMEEDKNADPETEVSEEIKDASLEEDDKDDIVDLSEKMDGVILREMTSVYEIYGVEDSSDISF